MAMLRIAGTRIKVKLLATYVQQGHNSQQIQQAMPHLSLAQIHAALAYYYDHQSEIDEENRRAEEISQAHANSPEQRAFVAKLLARAAAKGLVPKSDSP